MNSLLQGHAMSTPHLTCPKCDAVLRLNAVPIPGAGSKCPCWGTTFSLEALGPVAGLKSRGFVFNADLVSIVRVLEIGTRVSQGAR
jgi:hypothetical protein